MKTTKKGFTLIELIVVIAIIGVLAMILVPAMLGYVRKSKVSSANSAAATVQKAINTSLIELDEENKMTGSFITGVLSKVKDDDSVTGDNTTGDLYNKLVVYLDDVEKVAFQARVNSGVCDCVAASADGIYPGTYPSGIVTADNVKDYQDASGPDLDGVYAALIAKHPVEAGE